jgi:hypothetical protein
VNGVTRPATHPRSENFWLQGSNKAPKIKLTALLLCGEIEGAYRKSARGREGLVVFVAVLFGSQMFVKLAVEIARSTLDGQVSTAYHPRVYADRRRLTLEPFFTPATTEIPIKPKQSETIGIHSLATAEQIDWPTGTWTIMPSMTDRTLS